MPRRRVTVLALISTLAAMLVTGTGAASANVAANHRAASVTSGNARFQVLSPTLIRTEYAQDGKFTDSATFNAIGRAAFTPPPYTSSTSNGWLTITTSALTLKYQVDSGPFDAQNLSVHLSAGGSAVDATPWHRLTCGLGALCEAEQLPHSGAGVATDHTGYTGSGFLAGFEGTGDSVSADVTVGAAGTYTFDARYANYVGGDGQNTTRTLTLSVDGGASRTVSLPSTGSWDTWGLASSAVQLGAGQHTLTLTRTSADSGDVNLDSVAVVNQGSGFPPPPPPPSRVADTASPARPRPAASRVRRSPPPTTPGTPAAASSPNSTKGQAR